MPPSTQSAGAVKWDELEEIGKTAFDIWVDQPELNWAKEAWARLAAVRLTRYSNELEKTEVKIRFLALAGFYHDFCYVAWGETADPMYSCWADEIGISGVRMGQLLGRDPVVNEEEDRSELYDSALRMLIRHARSEVFSALLQAHDGTEGLLVSLWNSTKTHDRAECDFGEDGCNQCQESEDEILNDNTGEKLSAYSWLDQGAEELLEDG